MNKVSASYLSIVPISSASDGCDPNSATLLNIYTVVITLSYCIGRSRQAGLPTVALESGLFGANFSLQTPLCPILVQVTVDHYFM